MQNQRLCRWKGIFFHGNAPLFSIQRAVILLAEFMQVIIIFIYQLDGNTSLWEDK
ncbi:hypothetical protein [Pectobacterium sp. A5351]|uniref:hypothetical protein n=1 Tax=Pectobacterium sp. A5351 TaxID=2914983 RepID=UPI00232F520F|nr:hypothetical protein [Pectobacterium sp. A5351]WCG84606.1 hypothetical protein O1Q74_08330 [Pectobacterium sp. A5351]